jgi:mono/diheme cytochrome c family protein
MRHLLFAIGSIFLSHDALAQDGSVDRGRAVALQLCSGCHFVAEGQRPPSPVRAPTFRAVAASPSATETTLRNFLRTPHPIMPMLILSADETDDVIAYILSLRQR